MPPRRSAHQVDPTYSPSGRRYSLGPESPPRRSQRLGSEGVSSVNSFSLRATTPDARQLHATLRAASESPTKRRSQSRVEDSVHSSVTPSPPIQHTISTTSTPNAPSLNPAIATNGVSPLEPQTDRGFSFFRYPHLPSLGFRRNRGSSVLLSSPQRDEEFENESVVSWRLERELHKDDLQRRQAFDDEAETSQGQNIRRPPRRLSGLTWANDTADEPDPTATTDSPESSPVRTAAAKTIISSNVMKREDVESSIESTRPSTAEFTAPPVDKPRLLPTPLERQTFQRETRRRIPWGFTVINVSMAIITAAIFFTTWLTPIKPFAHRQVSYLPLNETEGRFVTQLTSEVDKLGLQLSSMSRDVHRLNSEQKRVVEQITAVQPLSETLPQINFLSLGLGARVDPMLTSPSIGTRRTFIRRFFQNPFLTSRQPPLPNPPETALQPWDDIGECWCSAPGNTGQAQLAVQLGQRTVPNEVVVEQIPFGASPHPELAPREMELWARFKPYYGSHDAATAAATETPVTSRSRRQGWFGGWQSTTSSSKQNTNTSPPSLSSLLNTIMATLHQAYPSESESAYSNDRLLGPSFFKLGEWEYDLHGESVQRFPLDAIVDLPTLRVDKVVIRVKSNWGGNHTCLYRVKLHGHV
ncbi:hypothetical protein BGW36DRAFT_297171 [Talaromyces proteolyticus]|uniref:SUN domain-containing protein n=1 Tax=Talaromyces proteolyticus TaxID=1131652 RepID=A0AAD4PXH9_9EURO|nr:uncharacterized protein BGW36DRAFT_297171 [Talaromyces proteolyticus]KAH8696394.1 hypothetical protein BGW36DRAFT_297171 [Talaromyces proteolyticus]